MVLGLVNYCDVTKDDTIEKDMEALTSRYPTAILKRVFVFNYSFDMPLKPNYMLNPVDDPDYCVSFLPEESNDESNTLEVQVRETISNITVKLILSLERQMSYCDQCRNKNIIPTAVTQLFTLYDDYDADFELAAGGQKLKTSILKKPVGRIRKYMGDICLQVSSPLDAIEHYFGSIFEARIMGDTMWLAGALLGYAVCIVQFYRMSIQIEEVAIVIKDYKSLLQTIPLSGSVISQANEMSKMLKIVDDRVNEAVAQFSKHAGCSNFELGSLIRLAIMTEKSNDPDKIVKVLDYIMRAGSIQGLNAMQRIECMLEGSMICRRLGLQRKSSMFLYMAGLMCVESNMHDTAYALLLQVCDDYGIDPRDIVLVNSSKSWTTMRLGVLLNLSYASKMSNNATTACQSISMVLRMINKSKVENSRFISAWDSVIQDIQLRATRSKSPTNSNRSLNFKQTLSEDVIREIAFNSRAPGIKSSIASSRSKTIVSNSLYGSGINGMEEAFSSGRKFQSALITSNANSEINYQSVAAKPMKIPDVVSSLRQVNEEINQATDAIKKGFKVITAPKFSSVDILGLMKDHRKSSERNRSKRRHPSMSASDNLSSPVTPRTSMKSNPVIPSQDSNLLFSIYSAIETCGVSSDLEEQALDMLDCTSREIRPKSRIHLPIKVALVRPLQASKFEVPVLISKDSCVAIAIACEKLRDFKEKSLLMSSISTSPTQDVKKSSLFYDPFAAKRAQQAKAQTPLEVLWNIKQPHAFLVVLSNPLSYPIHIDNIVLTFDASFGMKCELLPCSVDVPANTIAFPVEVAVRAFTLGKLRVKSITIFVNNAYKEVVIDEKDNCIDEILLSEATNDFKVPQLHNVNLANSNLVQIVSSSPLLDIISYQREERSFSNKVGSFPMTCCLFEGERKDYSFRLSSSSSPIDLRLEHIEDIRISISWSEKNQSKLLKGFVVQKKEVLHDFTGPLKVSDESKQESSDIKFCTIQSVEFIANEIEVKYTLDTNAKFQLQSFCLEVEVISSSEELNRLKKLLQTSEYSEDFVNLDESSLFIYSHIYSLEVVVDIQSGIVVDIIDKESNVDDSSICCIKDWLRQLVECEVEILSCQRNPNVTLSLSITDSLKDRVIKAKFLHHEISLIRDTPCNMILIMEQIANPTTDFFLTWASSSEEESENPRMGKLSLETMLRNYEEQQQKEMLLISCLQLKQDIPLNVTLHRLIPFTFELKLKESLVDENYVYCVKLAIVIISNSSFQMRRQMNANMKSLSDSYSSEDNRDETIALAMNSSDLDQEVVVSGSLFRSHELSKISPTTLHQVNFLFTAPDTYLLFPCWSFTKIRKNDNILDDTMDDEESLDWTTANHPWKIIVR